jgi:hypothetical protein
MLMAMQISLFIAFLIIRENDSIMAYSDVSSADKQIARFVNLIVNGISGKLFLMIKHLL